MWKVILLFVLLSPGVLFTLPPVGKKIWMSGKMSVLSVCVHAILFVLAMRFLKVSEGFQQTGILGTRTPPSTGWSQSTIAEAKVYDDAVNKQSELRKVISQSQTDLNKITKVIVPSKNKLIRLINADTAADRAATAAREAADRAAAADAPLAPLAPAADAPLAPLAPTASSSAGSSIVGAIASLVGVGTAPDTDTETTTATATNTATDTSASTTTFVVTYSGTPTYSQISGVNANLGATKLVIKQNTPDFPKKTWVFNKRGITTAALKLAVTARAPTLRQFLVISSS